MAVTYFCTIRRENWEKIRESNRYFLHLHWEKKMNSLNIGDNLIFYLMEEYKLVALYEVIGEAINTGEIMTIKIKLKDILKQPIDFRVLINRLDFIKNHQRWGTYIQVPLRKLNSSDEKLILKVFD